MGAVANVESPHALVSWDEDERRMIRTTVCGNVRLTDAEFDLFLSYAKRTGLDPIRRHIHAVKRRDKHGNYTMTIQTGIDGYRLIARRDGLAGIDDATFVDGPKYPSAATVAVYRWGPNGQKESYTATARWSEYYPGDGAPGMMWRKMPHTMLAKCAEALALRKGFSECAGLYTDEEMAQADAQVQPSVSPQPETIETTATERQDPSGSSDENYLAKLRARIHGMCAELRDRTEKPLATIFRDAVKAALDGASVLHPGELTLEQAERLSQELNRWLDETEGHRG